MDIGWIGIFEFVWTPFLIGLIGVSVKVVWDNLENIRARDRVLQAEKEAFRVLPEELVSKTAELIGSQEQLEQRTKQITDLLEQAQASLRVGVLFDLYSKQIEKYQTETRARAGWSFIFAILAMFAGLGFVIWGGTVVFTSSDWQRTAAGSSIAAIGGALSAYITKTFLDVHRLSLLQLNRYFRQPVVNAHILTAQRLADQLDEPDARRGAYSNIIARVVDLIREEAESTAAPSRVAEETPLIAKRHLSRRPRTKSGANTLLNTS